MRKLLLFVLLALLLSCGGDRTACQRIDGTWESMFGSISFNVGDMTYESLLVGQQSSGEIEVISEQDNTCNAIIHSDRTGESTEMVFIVNGDSLIVAEAGGTDPVQFARRD